jgi:hypothetical protein
MTQSGKTAQREARLGARLKANLARRKEQARQRESSQSPGPAVAPDALLREPAPDEGEENPTS